MLSRHRLPVLAVFLLTAGPLLAEGAPRIMLKKGDRVVFLGDSITQAGAGRGGYVTLIRQALDKHFGDGAVAVIGAGISGNKVPDLQKRLERDVLARKPTVVVIYIGINDVWHGERDPARGTAPERYTAGLEDVIRRIQGAGARVLLCTPSVIGEKAAGSNRNDKKLDEYAALSQKVAGKLNVPVCDLRRAFLDHLKSHNDANKDRGVLTSDGVHLNAAGNRFVADTMLKCLGL